MNINRLKSIDIFRGACMAWMILNHLIAWWLKIEYQWLQTIVIMILDPIGASGFLFISGVSIALSYRKRLINENESETNNYRIVRNSYLFRAFFIFLIAILYNLPVAIVLRDPTRIWTWFVLLTAAVSIFLAWPLLKMKKSYRILIAILILIIHFSIISWLLPFRGDSNIFGLIFHLLYNDISQDPILIFFPFFIIGTVIGDVIYDTIYSNDQDNQNLRFKKKMLIPTCFVGILLIISGVLINFPYFIWRESLSWVIYSIGVDLIFLCILLAIEKSEIFKPEKSYKFLFYYSYYSLTIYLAHNLLYFLFLKQLDLLSIWIFTALSFVIMGFILRGIYKTLGAKASLKVQIGRLSQKITMKIEERLLKRELNQNS